MSANSELVLTTLAAMQERDFDRYDQFAHPDMELDLTERVLNPASYSGRDGLKRLTEEIDEIWESATWTPGQPVEAGDVVFLPVIVRLEGKGSGLAMEEEIYFVHWIRDGLLERIVVRSDREAAEQLFREGTR
jgi:ketosteroid isomerase-like protein